MCKYFNGKHLLFMKSKTETIKESTDRYNHVINQFSHDKTDDKSKMNKNIHKM